MMSQRRLSISCAVFGFAFAAIPLIFAAAVGADIPAMSHGAAGFVFPSVSAALAAFLARYFDPQRFGPLRALGLSSLLFIALCLLESVIWFSSSWAELGGSRSAALAVQLLLGIPLIVIAFGGMWFGWIMLPMSLLFGLLYRFQTMNRSGQDVNEKPAQPPTEPAQASAWAVEPMPISAPPPDVAKPVTPTTTPLKSDAPADGSANANWPLEDLNPDTVARWQSRIVKAYPILLSFAVVVGLGGGYAARADANANIVLGISLIVIIPVYALFDAIFNARFGACLLRTCSLPLALFLAYSVLDDAIPIEASLLVTAAYCAISVPVVAIVRWHRVSMAGAGSVGFAKWMPKIGYAYLVLAGIFLIYAEFVGTSMTLLGITVIYFEAALVIFGLVMLTKKIRRKSAAGSAPRN